MIGTVIAERFRIEQELGVGTMGQVYEAVRVRDGAKLAVKILRPDLGEEIAARFTREGKALAMFDHENIIRFVEAGLDGEHQYLVTELVRGATLRDLMEGGPIEPSRALAIIRQVLLALGHVHDLGVVHRDMKPENIMLVDGGKPGEDADLVKMLDFGVAKLASDTAAVLEENKLTRTGFETFGTALYMPPEVALGRQVDARSDLYAVGAILFEMLAGRPLFDEQDVIVLMGKHASKRPPTMQEAAPHVPATPELELLLSESLAKDVNKRFRSAADMIAALDAASHSLEPLPAPAPPMHVPTPPVGVPAAQPRDATLQLVPPAVRAQTAPMMPPGRGDPAFVSRAEPTPLGSPIPPRAPSVAEPPRSVASVSSSSTDRKPSSVAAYLAKLPPRVKRNALIGAGAVVVAIVLVIALSGGGSSAATAASAKPRDGGKPNPALSKQATELLAAGNHVAAIDLLEAGIANGSGDADTHLALGHARAKAGQRTAALAAYERAVHLDKSRGRDERLVANLEYYLEGKDAVAGVIALEVALAADQRDLVIAQASKGKQLDIRQRAVAIAEREGFGDQIDRVESWSLDLAQAVGCESKRAIVAKLKTTDARAVPALRRAKGLKCIEKDVVDALVILEDPAR